MSYLFRREDNDAVVELSFAEAMAADCAGFVTLSDGVTAKRCVHMEGRSKPRPARDGSTAPFRMKPSDALGFGQHQLADFEEDRARNNFTGVEFVRDPQVPEFIQVQCDSRQTYNRYAKHRGYVNKNDLGGVILSEKELEGARIMVERSLERPERTLRAREVA